MKLETPKQKLSETTYFHEEESIFPFKIMVHEKVDENDQGKKVEEEIKIVLGNAIISNKDFFTIEDAVNYINQKPWELIVNLFCYTLEMQKNEKS